MTPRQYNKRVTDKDIKKMRAFVRKFGIGMRMSSKICGDFTGISGLADYLNGMIYIHPHTRDKFKNFVSVVMHELWHCLCYKEGMFLTYHYTKEPKTAKEMAKYRRVALKAERFVDKKAKEMTEKHFPGLPYIQSYQTKEDQEWFHEHILDRYFRVSNNKKKEIMVK